MVQNERLNDNYYITPCDNYLSSGMNYLMNAMSYRIYSPWGSNLLNATYELYIESSKLEVVIRI